MKNSHNEKFNYEPKKIEEIKITDDMEQNFNKKIMEILG